MRLADTKLSFPCVSYDVEVSHFASRQATAIEWVILEAIQASSNDPQFNDAPFSAVFEEILSIKEADRLIKPVIVDLIGHGMLSVQGLSDGKSLSDMKMSQFSLTEKGQRLRKDGVLPGRTMQDVVTLYFDAFAEEIEEAKGKGLMEEATGLKAIEANEPADIGFPSSKIMALLENRKGSNKYSWLSKNTHIEDISEIGATLMWKNVSKRLEVEDDGSCALLGVDNANLAARALESLEFSFTGSAPEASLSDQSLSISWIDSPRHLFDKVKSLIGKSAVVIVDSSIAEEHLASFEKGVLSGTAVLVSSSKSLNSRFLNGALIIEIPRSLISSGAVCESGEECMSVGTFSLYAGNYNKALPLLYGSTTRQGNVAEKVREIAKEYACDLPAALVPLFCMGDAEQAKSILGSSLESLSQLDLKVDYIKSLNKMTATLLGEPAISSTELKGILAKELGGYFENYTYDNIIDRISECMSIEAMNDSPEMRSAVLSSALSSLSPSDSIGQVWALWEALEQRGWDYRASAISEMRNIYSESCLKQILSVFSSDELYAMPAYTPIEAAVLQMRRITDSVAELLPGIDLLRPVSLEEARVFCLEHKESLFKVYSELKAWREKQEDVARAGINLADSIPAGSSFESISTSIESLFGGIEPFYDEQSMKYDKVFVIDTCAIMNNPNVLNQFEDNKAMLVVPQVVLDELDANKVSSDEEKAFKARDAIRAIDNHRTFKWLNLTESSHPELLSADCDRNRNDNLILSVAIKYLFKRPTLITDDANLRNLAQANCVKPIGSSEFLDLKREQRRSGQASKKNKGKGKKR